VNAGVSSSLRRAGFWSAALATFFSIAYSVAQIAEWLGWLGSAGGGESASTPLGLAVLLTPSLLLGPSFLVLMVSVHGLAAPERKVWSHAAVAFATAYVVLTGMTYFVQLTWVAPRLARGELQGVEAFLFTPFDSFLYAVDILGYSFMSVATLFAGVALAGNGIERIARRFLLANGLILPFLVFQMYVHGLLWVASLWAITFSGSTWSLAVLFARVEPDASPSHAAATSRSDS
jgi:hypothetical protein